MLKLYEYGYFVDFAQIGIISVVVVDCDEFMFK